MAEEMEVTSKKAPTEVTNITMTDGRVVGFAGKQKARKTITILESGDVMLRIDFLNGSTVTLKASECPENIQADLLGHGMSQKVGDEYSGETDVEDMVLAAESMAERLRAGDWKVARESGDSFSGGSIVIRALVEMAAGKKTVADIKAFLQGKLDAAKASGQKLSRAALYASFRAPGTKTAAIIVRLESEKAAKVSGLSALDMEAELAG